MRSKSLVVLATALLLVASAAPALAADGSLSVSVDQADDGSVIATVTHNESAVENASVDVDAVDGNYSDVGTYSTDENGTITLSAPTENVTIEVTATYENATANDTAEFTVAGNDETPEFDSFGSRVSWFVHRLIGDRDDGSGIGQAVAQFVVKHNPGNAPDHAGPSDDNGPPAFVEGDDEDGNVTATGASNGHGKSGERGNGPPEDRGSNGNGAANGHDK